MRRLPPVLVAIAVLCIPSALAATQTVDITRAGFTPNKVTIDFGDTVTWTNKDTSNHQVLADQAAFPTSPVLAANQTYSYTFAKSIDESSGIRVQGQDTLFPQNSYCRRCERALSAFDTRHRFVTSALWDVPVGRGRRVDIQNSFANAAIGGWQAGFVWTVQTGFPQTVTVG